MVKFYFIGILATLAVAVHGVPRPPLCSPCYYALDAAPMAADTERAWRYPGYPNDPNCLCYCQETICPACLQDCPNCAVAPASPMARIAPDAIAMPLYPVDCDCSPSCDPNDCYTIDVECSPNPIAVAYK